MSKINEIIDGWKHVIWQDENTEKEAKRRLLICETCPNRSDYPGEPKAVSTCNLCGCPLISKTRSINSRCPDNRW